MRLAHNRDVKVSHWCSLGIAQTDATCWAAALRETKEELGIDPPQVEILGRIGPPEKSLKGLRVWPYVVSPT